MTNDQYGLLASNKESRLFRGRVGERELDERVDRVRVGERRARFDRADLVERE